MRLLLLVALLLLPAPLYAQGGRVFDGTDDQLLSANNAVAALDTNQKSWSFWFTMPSNSGISVLALGLTADGTGNGRIAIITWFPDVAGFQIGVLQDHATDDGIWTTADSAAGVRTHVAVTYDRSATTNEPVFYINGTLGVTGTIQAPVGAVVTGEDTLKLGQGDYGTSDATGTIQHLAIYSGLLTATQVKQAMYWGRPKGGVISYYPFTSSSLASHGSATATLTATGTTVAAFVTPVVRPGTVLLGLLGW